MCTALQILLYFAAICSIFGKKPYDDIAMCPGDVDDGIGLCPLLEKDIFNMQCPAGYGLNLLPLDSKYSTLKETTDADQAFDSLEQHEHSDFAQEDDDTEDTEYDEQSSIDNDEPVEVRPEDDATIEEEEEAEAEEEEVDPSTPIDILDYRLPDKFSDYETEKDRRPLKKAIPRYQHIMGVSVRKGFLWNCGM